MAVRRKKPVSRWRGPTRWLEGRCAGEMAEMTSGARSAALAGESRRRWRGRLRSDPADWRGGAESSTPAASAAPWHRLRRRRPCRPRAASVSGPIGEAVEQQDQRVGERGPSPGAERGVEGQQALQPGVGQVVLDDVGDVDQDHPQEVAQVGRCRAARSRQAEAGERRSSCRPSPASRGGVIWRNGASDAAASAASAVMQRRPGGGVGRCVWPRRAAERERRRRASSVVGQVAGCEARGRAGQDPCVCDARVEPGDSVGEARDA